MGRRQWWPTPVLLPGKSHAQRSLVGCSPWESDTTERLCFHFSLPCIEEGNVNPLQCSCLENPGNGGAWGAAIYGVAQSQRRLKWFHKSESEVAQSCPTLCDPIDCSLPGSSIHGIFQAVVLEWIAISFFRGSSQPRARTQVSHIVDRYFTIWATREVTKIFHFLYRKWYCKIIEWLKSMHLKIQQHQLKRGASAHKILYFSELCDIYSIFGF